MPPAPPVEETWNQQYPPPEPNADVARLIGESKAAAAAGDEALSIRKMEEAVEQFARWLHPELQRLHRDGIAAAARGGPRLPREISDILHRNREAAALGVENNATELAGQVLSRHVRVRFDQLRTSGMALAASAPLHPPPEVGEIIGLERQLDVLGVEGGTGMRMVEEILGLWARSRLEVLEQDASEAIDAGSEAIPRQVAEAIQVARVMSLISDSDSDDGLAEQAMELTRSILLGWSEERARTLGTAGVDEAALASAQPPGELARLRGISTELAKLEVQATRADDAVWGILTAWIDAHMERLVPPGRAAAFPCPRSSEGSHRHSRLGECVAYGDGHVHRTRSVAVEAERLGPDGDLAVAERRHAPTRGHGDSPPRDDVGIGERRPVHRPWGQGAAREVSAVRERLRHHSDTHVLEGRARHLPGGARHDDDRQLAVERHHGPAEGVRHALVGVQVVVQRAVRLHVVQALAFYRHECPQRTELEDDVGEELVRREAHGTSSEPDEVRVARVGAQREPELDGSPDGPAQPCRIAGMETAGEVDGGHVREQSGLVDDRPPAVRLPRVSPEVYPAVGEVHSRMLATPPYRDDGDERVNERAPRAITRGARL